MTLARILGKQKGRPSYASDDRLVLPSCQLGLEFEYEGVEDHALPAHTYADHWAYHEERSLRDHGAEFVFAMPLFGADAWNSVDWLMSYAVEQKWKCTKRTGIHVHVDVRDLEVPQLAGMCLLYAAVEPYLYKWIGDARDVSHFCLPLYRSDDSLYRTCEIIKMALVDSASGSNMALKLSDGFQRYAGFNLQALAKFGSIEFRHLQTTHDKERVFSWINMCLSLKAAAYRLPRSDGSVVEMLESLHPRDALNYIFGEEVGKVLYSKQTGDEFYIGLDSARDIAVHGCTPFRWSRTAFPKGGHRGFLTWLKNADKVPNKTKSAKYALDVLDDIGNMDIINPLPPPVRANVNQEGEVVWDGQRWLGLEAQFNARQDPVQLGQAAAFAQQGIRPVRR